MGRSTSEWPGVIACCLVRVSKPIGPAPLGDRPQESLRKEVVPLKAGCVVHRCLNRSPFR